MNGVVEAVIVNHNTSLFAEIALRSLHRSAACAPVAIRTTIVDNHSSDDTAALRATADACGAAWQLSRWPAGQQPVNTHGDVLRDFVLDRPDAAGYLLLDSDMALPRPDTVGVLVTELVQDDTVWAVQARQLTPAAATAEARPSGLRAAVRRRQRLLHLSADLRTEGTDGSFDTLRMVHSGRKLARCHPGCALLRNSAPFQTATRQLGLSPAWTWANDPTVGGLNDTLGLVSQAMRTHGKRVYGSTASVVHFWHGSRIAVTAEHRELLRLSRREDWSEFQALVEKIFDWTPAD